MYEETGANTLTIANSIIWNNVSTHGDGSLELYEIVGQNGSADPILGNNLIKYGQYGSMGDDPQFVDADNGNFQLLAASPAIDAGDNSAAGFVASDTDLIDHHRVINDVVDLGAYEALTDKIINNGESSFKGFSGTLDITGNPYENDLENTYKWKMIISSPSISEILLVDPNDLVGYSALMTGMGITFDSTHFQVSDLSVMPTLLGIITQESGWDNFTGDIILSRPVYPNLGTEDSLISNTITITIESVLPVTITDFTGQVQNGLATLSWHTAAESAFDHFELEKSLDGKIFTIVAKISATGDNSIYRKVTAQSEQKAFYRLKLVNKDGSSSYYRQVLTLAQNTSSQTLSVYPNPATTTIHINVDIAAHFRLFDGAGKAVKSGALKAGLNDINIANLSKGVYFGEIDGVGRFKVIKK
ncbi:T9SS type A sorting domain-containing protein [Arachidicoccus ginsenosidivorans]|uniref:T9SS type A sorting domain-containing protein n=1 Tax=Arachidicoccus ginsenosidivorans TaxID=496057 RepID=A0A5B8VJQ8_9BACT|nr:T9SS type A sorting domain-containing protein [Arachidicoccus ginsenosidivorans]QEC71559.1 T9SS type A sorting domain-containing protein [Arachidicoccus ginsenosidivorans]